MIRKIFGKKRNPEDGSYSEIEKQNLSRKFIINYAKSAQNNDDVITNIVEPLYNKMDKEIKAKSRHIPKDIKLGDYNSAKLNLYSQTLLSQIKRENKHYVYEGMAKELALKAISKEKSRNSPSRKEQKLKSNANELLKAYGTSYEKMIREKQDEEFAKKLQDQLYIEQSNITQSQGRKKVKFKFEEEKCEIEPMQCKESNYEIDNNIERYKSQQEIADEKLAKILQAEEDNKTSSSFAKNHNSEKRNKKNRTFKQEDISPEAILRQRSERELSRQDYIDGMMAGFLPF